MLNNNLVTCFSSFDVQIVLSPLWEAYLDLLISPHWSSLHLGHLSAEALSKQAE